MTTIDSLLEKGLKNVELKIKEDISDDVNKDLEIVKTQLYIAFWEDCKFACWLMKQEKYQKHLLEFLRIIFEKLGKYYYLQNDLNAKESARKDVLCGIKTWYDLTLDPMQEEAKSRFEQLWDARKNNDFSGIDKFKRKTFRCDVTKRIYPRDEDLINGLDERFLKQEDKGSFQLLFDTICHSVHGSYFTNILICKNKLSVGILNTFSLFLQKCMEIMLKIDKERKPTTEDCGSLRKPTSGAAG
ncbi:hypothetical protein K9L27_03345 [Candidatus Gracilibacteria bacterium]|nr:hypothetical protein [Candidatus Gracilibacteria bacterium]